MNMNIGHQKRSQNPRNLEVNGIIYYSMRRKGKGYGGLKGFFYLLNHPLPMTKNNYDEIAANFHKAAKHVRRQYAICIKQRNMSEDSMQFA